MMTRCKTCGHSASAHGTDAAYREQTGCCSEYVPGGAAEEPVAPLPNDAICEKCGYAYTLHFDGDDWDRTDGCEFVPSFIAGKYRTPALEDDLYREAMKGAE